MKSRTSENGLVLPLVHMNGTSKRDLVDQLCDANSAIQLAITAVKNAAPHMRDFYPYEDSGEAFNLALKQYGARILKLEAVSIELIEVATAIQKNS